jgi:hypothetical protein
MNEFIYRTIKYIIAGVVLVLLLYYLPENKLSIQDILTILAIIVATQFLLDFICFSMMKKDNCKCPCPCEDEVEGFTTGTGANDGSKKSEDTQDAQSTNKKLSTAEKKSQTSPNDDDGSCNGKYVAGYIGNQSPIMNDNSENDMEYDELGFAVHDPMGQLNNPNRRKFRDKKSTRGEYGDWYIPPEEWYPPCIKPPICVTNNGCPVQPTYSEGSYADLRDFDNVRKVTQETVNIPYSKKVDRVTRPATNKDVNEKMKKVQAENKEKENKNTIE